MATNGIVAFKTEDGWRGVYNKWDSIPSRLGAELIEKITKYGIEEVTNRLEKIGHWEEFNGDELYDNGIKDQFTNFDFNKDMGFVPSWLYILNDKDMTMEISKIIWSDRKPTVDKNKSIVIRVSDMHDLDLNKIELELEDI